MNFYLDVYFPPGLTVDRDEIEERIGALECFEAVGGGAGHAGSNLDFLVRTGDTDTTADAAVRRVTEVLEALGAAGGARINVTTE